MSFMAELGDDLGDTREDSIETGLESILQCWSHILLDRLAEPVSVWFHGRDDLIIDSVVDRIVQCLGSVSNRGQCITKKIRGYRKKRTILKYSLPGSF